MVGGRGCQGQGRLPGRSVSRGGDRVRSGPGRARRCIPHAGAAAVARRRPVSSDARLLRAGSVGASRRGSSPTGRDGRRDGTVRPSGAASSPHAHPLRRDERGAVPAGLMRRAGRAATVTFANLTDIGRVRARKEDSLGAFDPDALAFLPARGLLFVVADGMGGRARGDVASRVAVEALRAAYYATGRSEPLPESLRVSVQSANEGG